MTIIDAPEVTPEAALSAPVGLATQTKKRWYKRPARLVLAVVGGLFALSSVAALVSPKTDKVVTLAPTSAAPVITRAPASPTSTAAPTTAAPTTAAPTTTTAAPTTTTAAPTTTAAVAGSLSALDVLAMIPLGNEVQGGYSRELFAEGADADGNGCATRAEVLIRSSASPVQNGAGCDVLAGEWVSLYDGVTYSDPSALEVDHVVALKEAWDSGADAWDPVRRAAFANDLDDPRSLVAVTGSVNGSKGDKDPSNWLPPLEADQCRFIGDWVAIKARWGLSMDQSEYGRIRNMLNGPCAGQTIAPWTTVAVVASVTTAPPASAAPPVAPPPAGNVYYANCAAARAAGAAPLHSGEPGYRSGLDRDSDGAACE